jgi:hypothetical protein
MTGRPVPLLPQERTGLAEARSAVEESRRRDPGHIVRPLMRPDSADSRRAAWSASPSTTLASARRDRAVSAPHQHPRAPGPTDRLSSTRRTGPRSMTHGSPRRQRSQRRDRRKRPARGLVSQREPRRCGALPPRQDLEDGHAQRVHHRAPQPSPAVQPRPRLARAQSRDGHGITRSTARRVKAFARTPARPAPPGPERGRRHRQEP